MIDDEVWNYTWEHGRQLASMTTATGSATWSYTYDSNGLRTSRTGGNLTYQYIYEGDKLVMLKRGNTVMRFVYDAQGRPMMMDYNGTPYYYIRNAQGDVMALADANGVRVVRYTYDAWGNPLSAIGMKVDTVGKHNPLRYRGYVYDWETGLYYLQSRYYNPEIGRFINADAYASTSQGILGNNMFAYCQNNPIIFHDSEGTAIETVFDVLSLIASAVEVAVNPTDIGAWIGLVGDTVDLIPFVTGVGETVRALRTASKIADGSDIVIDTYRNVKKVANGAVEQVHHILEKRLAKQINPNSNLYSIMSIALDKEAHQVFTNAFRDVAQYGKQHNLETIVRAGYEAYKNNPQLMGAFLYSLEQIFP